MDGSRRMWVYGMSGETQGMREYQDYTVSQRRESNLT